MWNLPPNDSVLHVLSLICAGCPGDDRCTSGWAPQHGLGGVCMLGCLTALGGGTIRDVLLGEEAGYALLTHPTKK